MRIVRWKGLLGFGVALVLLALVVELFFDTSVKWGVESFGSRVVGAEVNVAKVDHQFSPFSIILRGLQVTDASSPERNLFEADELAARIEFLPFFSDKIIIDKLAMTGAKFGTERAAPGRLYSIDLSLKKRVERVADSGVARDIEARLALPSVDELIAAEDLQTTAAINRVEAVTVKYKVEVRQAYEQLPDEPRLKRLAEDLSVIRDADYRTPAELLSGKERLDAFKKEVQRERDKVAQAKDVLLAAQRDGRDALAQLEAAPRRDYDQLKRSLTGATSLDALTERLFGESVRRWGRYTLSALETVAPLLQHRAEQDAARQRVLGRWVSFSDDGGLPSFLIREADVDLEFSQQHFVSRWQDVTGDHKALGRATRYTLASAQVGGDLTLELNGRFSFTDAGLNAEQRWQASGVELSDISLINSDVLRSDVVAAKLASSGVLEVTAGELDGAGSVNLSPLRLSSSSTEVVGKRIAGVVDNLEQIKIQLGVTGRYNAPHISLGSNLDEQVAAIVAASVSGEAKVALAELRQKLDAKAAGPSAEVTTVLASWQGLSASADQRENILTEMMSAKLSGAVGGAIDQAVDEKKDKVKDELKKKLFGG
ncbi:TIGR03545 family protein [Teredinibacter waterburyi]|uniref:TIGR03545 family protein n=1 Tax=Teredinibacter waterburyi TaxID=1500538 RepID=UPI00165F8CE0|nr:TIGR03545 family protein [Teredinibacter waterburyi]